MNHRKTGLPVLVSRSDPWRAILRTRLRTVPPLLHSPWNTPLRHHLHQLHEPNSRITTGIDHAQASLLKPAAKVRNTNGSDIAVTVVVADRQSAVRVFVADAKHETAGFIAARVAVAVRGAAANPRGEGVCDVGAFGAAVEVGCRGGEGEGGGGGARVAVDNCSAADAGSYKNCRDHGCGG